jgi:hypothetical protein
VFPLSRPSLGDWSERVCEEGFPLVVAMRGIPVVVLHVINIRPGTEDIDRARWVGEGAAEFWVVADVGWYPSGTLNEFLQTWSDASWVDGLGPSPGQSAWRCMRFR